MKILTESSRSARITVGSAALQRNSFSLRIFGIYRICNDLQEIYWICMNCVQLVTFRVLWIFVFQREFNWRIHEELLPKWMKMHVFDGSWPTARNVRNLLDFGICAWLCGICWKNTFRRKTSSHVRVCVLQSLTHMITVHSPTIQ